MIATAYGRVTLLGASGVTSVLRLLLHHQRMREIRRSGSWMHVLTLACQELSELACRQDRGLRLSSIGHSACFVPCSLFAPTRLL